MSNKYFTGNKGHYIFCDICGQACYDWQVVKMDAKTGRGGLLVCPNDADIIDYGLIPYRVSVEQSVRFARVNLNDTTNAEPPIDYDVINPMSL